MGEILARRGAGTVATNDPRFARMLGLAAKQPHLWFGPSGERVTGAEVAAHLAAVFELLERDGWLRTRRVGGRLESGNTLSGAMYRVRSNGPGDADSWSVSRRCLDLVLSARSEPRAADHEAWSEKRGRTWGEVRDLLVIAAEFAHRYGPEVA